MPLSLMTLTKSSLDNKSQLASSHELKTDKIKLIKHVSIEKSCNIGIYIIKSYSVTGYSGS
jgi:hypothetical protein